jgi:hypothetical protein
MSALSDKIDVVSAQMSKLNNTLKHCNNATIHFIQARTQADCVICYWLVRHDIQAAIANDSDFILVARQSMMLFKDWTIST